MEKMTKEMFELFKSSLDGSWNTVTMLQSQAERMARLMLDQFSVVQAEGRKRIEEWMEEAKKKQEEFRKLCDEGMKRMSEVVQPKP